MSLAEVSRDFLRDLPLKPGDALLRALVARLATDLDSAEAVADVRQLSSELRQALKALGALPEATPTPEDDPAAAALRALRGEQ